MKRHAQQILAVCLLLPSFLLAEQILYETGFEESEGVSVGSLEGTSTEWKTNGPNPFEIIARDDGEVGQMMASQSEFASEGSRAWLNNFNFDGERKIIVEMSLKANNSGSRGCQANVHLGNFNAAPGSSGMAAIISFRGSGRIVAFDGENEVELMQLSSTSWHILRIECDPVSQTFDVIVDGDARATGLAFNDPDAHEILSLGLTHYTGSDAISPSGLAVDNVKIWIP